MTKMQDVAKMAHVSSATVSRVLSNQAVVTPATRQRVLNAIEVLGYKPNRLASNLRKKSSNTIMVVLPDITNSFFAGVVQGIESVARNRGYHVVLGDAGNSLDLEREFIELVNEKFVDGLILATARIPKQEVMELSWEIPIVLACEYFDGFDVPTVSIDNVGAAREATQHLISLGHQRIGFISGPLGIVLCRDRLRGYRQALLMNEIEVVESLVQEGDFTFKGGYDVMLKWLATGSPPTAVFAANDVTALGAMRAIQSRGLQVPHDISIVGFDDVPECEYVNPGLTTINQPRFRIGSLAADMLVDIIEGDEVKRKQIVLPNQLVVRGTTTYAPNSQRLSRPAGL